MENLITIETKSSLQNVKCQTSVNEDKNVIKDSNSNISSRDSNVVPSTLSTLSTSRSFIIRKKYKDKFIRSTVPGLYVDL